MIQLDWQIVFNFVEFFILLLQHFSNHKSFIVKSVLSFLESSFVFFLFVIFSKFCHISYFQFGLAFSSFLKFCGELALSKCGGFVLFSLESVHTTRKTLIKECNFFFEWLSALIHFCRNLFLLLTSFLQLFVTCVSCLLWIIKWYIFKTAILSQSPPFERTCGGQEATCPQRRENYPICKKIAKTRRSSSKANSRRR